MTSFLSGMNPEQQDAVRHDTGPMLVLAGAGSGKTSVLVARAGRLVQERVVAPDALVVLTFTNKAARELKARVAAKLGRPGEKIWAGTFHAFGLALLKKYGHHIGLPKRFSVVDPTDAADLIKELLGDLKHADKKAFDSGRLLSRLGSWRESGQTEAGTADPYEEATQFLLPRYQQRLARLALVDFDELLLGPTRLLDHPTVGPEIRSRYEQIMVDEFQDTNAAQMAMLDRLAASHRNLAVVGDDDQSIYGWRGAQVSNILTFPKRFAGCKVVRLERNYRSTAPILALANHVIAENAARHGKVLKSAAVGGDATTPEILVFDDEEEEATWVAGDIEQGVRAQLPRSEIAVLYRSNGQSTFFEAELRRLRIDYKVTGGTSFFDRREVRDAMAYLRCAFAPHDVAIRRILNLPARGVGERAFERLQLFADAHRLRFVDAVRRAGEAELDPKVAANLAGLMDTLRSLKADLLAPGQPGQTLAAMLERIGYRDHLRKVSTDGVAAERRWKVIETFATIVDRAFESRERNAKEFQAFLERLELRDEDDDDASGSGKVSLMTLHACKGLEFSRVYLVGVEEDLLPHRSLGSDVDEERRLFYVGLTRAKTQLVLTRAKRRQRHGRRVEQAPSRFLSGIPNELLVEHQSTRPLGDEGRASLMRALYEQLKA